MLNRHGVFLRLGWYLLCCALVINFCFTDFVDDRDPSIRVNLRGPQTCFQVVIHRQNLFNKNFGYQSTTQYETSQNASRIYFAVWRDQDIICNHSACNSDAQLSVDMYRGGGILSPGTGTARKK